MAGPMHEPITGIAGEALVRGESVVPTAAPASIRTTHPYLVKVAAAGVASVGAVAMGQDTVGETCSYVPHGTAQCLAAAAVPAQSPITPSADGRWQVATTGQIVHGYSTTAATAAGQLFTAELGHAGAGSVAP